MIKRAMQVFYFLKQTVFELIKQIKQREILILNKLLAKQNL